MTGVVFDVGAHTGEDTAFYLGKGFRVIAVEANPRLVRDLEERFRLEIDRGDLVVVPGAMGACQDDSARFFVNLERPDLSSLNREVAAKGAMPVEEVTVTTVTLETLFERFGVPHYLKVDIERSDTAVAESLLRSGQLPAFASFELHGPPRILTLLAACGYDRFQIVNQWCNRFLTAVQPAREGEFFWPADGMGPHHSGMFGAELPPEDWIDLADALELYAAQSLISRFGHLRNSWFDVHASRSSATPG